MSDTRDIAPLGDLGDLSDMAESQALLELSHIDFLLLRLKKQLESLPQRQKLLDLHSKRAEVERKAEQVRAMRKECEQAIKALADEDATLREKMEEAQAQIDVAENYKEVTSLSREIEGFVKRLEKIEFDSLKHMEHADKISVVEAQVEAALEKLTRQDADLRASYQAESTALLKEQAVAQQLRIQLTEILTPGILKRYERAREAKGGVGSAHLEGTHCSGCHVELTAGQIAKLKHGSAASVIEECPYCHRLLVVEV